MIHPRTLTRRGQFMTDLEKYIIARWTYSLGHEWISNAEYQLLHNKMMATMPDNEYVKRSWSSDPCPSELLIRYNMPEYIKAVTITDKTESIPSLGSFAEIESLYKTLDSKATISYKHDGWNMQFDYYNGDLIWAQTRGRASNAKEAHDLMSHVPAHIPVSGKVKVVCECTVPNHLFPEVTRVVGNQYQRSAVSTLLARGGEYTKYLECHAFAIHGTEYDKDPLPVLKSWGFKVPAWKYIYSFDELMDAIREFDQDVYAYDSPTDGLVVSGVITRALRVMHWEEPIYKSYVLLDDPYIEKYGAHRISVEARIYPIRLPNSVQRIIPVTNYQRVIDNNLRPGFPIAFQLKSHADADIDEVATKLLQEQYAGNYEAYRAMVESNEVIKEMMV